MGETMKRKEQLAAIRAALKGGGDYSILSQIPPEDLAEIIAELESEERVVVFNHLDLKTAGIVLDDTGPITRKDLLDNIDRRFMAYVLGEMPADEAADAIAEVEPERARELFAQMPTEDSEEIRDILKYPSDSAGGIMSPVLVSVEETMTVAQAIDRLRESEIDEQFYYTYVLDRRGLLIGVVPLRRFLTSQPGTPVREIMEEKVVKARVDMDQEEVAGLIRKYDLPALPVVDGAGKLVGRVTADDAIDVITEEATEDIYLMAGTDDEEIEQRSAIGIARIRLQWLLICICGSLVSGFVIRMFNHTLARTMILVSFIPVIMATGGNSGLQASTTVIRGLATGTVKGSGILKEVAREVRVAAILGAACGVLLSGVALIWSGNPMIGVIIGVSMFLAVTFSTIMGVFLPLFFNKVNIDPAISSGPLITTLNDAIGVSFYLITSTLFIRLLSA